MIYLYNTEKRTRVPFEPLEEGHVRMYTCGPTVHDAAHIGNFRTFVFEDLLRRVLKLAGYRVTQVMNFTDVDDKTIRKSRAAGMSLEAFTQRYKDKFLKDVDRLRIERAEHYPSATAYIGAMVEMVQKLEEGGHTYRAQGSVYFRIESYPSYGALTRLDPSQHRATGRVDHDEYDKENPQDFALWKAWSEDDGDVFWETPLGKGRPGWHIECSAMSTKLLGTHFDIHTGGVDNLFPHHENERAQSVCAHHDAFVNVWMHSAHLKVNGQKMSKSLGNFYTLDDLLEKGHTPEAVRYALLSTHYRASMNLTEDVLRASQSAIDRLRDVERRLVHIAQKGPTRTTQPVTFDTHQNEFRASLWDDLGISSALGALFLWVRAVHTAADSATLDRDQALQALRWLRDEADAVLNILHPTTHPNRPPDQDINHLIQARTEARRARRWEQADALRDTLESMGVIVRDTPDGVVWFWDA